MTWEVWGPPIVVLLLALVVALVLLLVFQSRSAVARTSGGGDRALELETQKGLLVDRIKELDADRHRLDPAEFAAQREALVKAAAQLLREKEQRPAGEPAVSASGGPSSPGASDPPKVRSTGGVVAWVGGTVVFFAILGLGLSRFSTPRNDPPMEGAMGAGGGAPMAAAMQAQSQAVKDAEAALETNPNDLKALNLLTHEALRARDVQGAMAWIDRARAVNEDDPEVQTHLAVLQIAVGMFDRAKVALDKALTADPKLGEALVWKGVVALNEGDEAGAKAAFGQAAALETTPLDLRLMAQQALQEIENGTLAMGGGANQGGAAQGGATQGAATVGAGETGAVRVEGTVTVPDGWSSPPGATLFVIAKRAKEGGGPPVAAKKMSLASTPFPASFSLVDGDMMLGGTWPEQVFLEARVDGDGNAMTKDDVVAASDGMGPVASGSGGIVLTLSPK